MVKERTKKPIFNTLSENKLQHSSVRMCGHTDFFTLKSDINLENLQLFHFTSKSTFKTKSKTIHIYIDAYGTEQASPSFVFSLDTGPPGAAAAAAAAAEDDSSFSLDMSS